MPENNKTDYTKILERVSQGIPVDSANKRPKFDERKSSIGQEEPKEPGEKEDVQPVSYRNNRKALFLRKVRSLESEKEKYGEIMTDISLTGWTSLTGSRYISPQTPIAGSCGSST